VGARGRAGPLWPVGQKGGGGPKGEEIHFLFINKISRFSTLIQIQILKMKKTFSQFAPKTKVVQNLILYNFHLGHFSKL
jgi:hypothetical protein